MEYIEIIKALGMTPAQLATFGVLYIIGAAVGVLPKPKRWFNGKNGEPEWAKQLKGHFNEDITSELKGINDKLNTVCNNTKSISEEQKRAKEDRKDLLDKVNKIYYGGN